jgi:dephospho-CoA kinase
VLLVALTGGIGSGKSLAGEFFAQLGATEVDSDQLSREVIERGTPGFDLVIARFGDAILTDGIIDRKKLAEIIFSDAQAKKDLENIIHPLVRTALNKIVVAAKDREIVINQIPLLVETGGADRFHKVIVVQAAEDVRRERLRQRGMLTSDIDKRIASQASDEERLAIADFLIRNDGDKDALLRQVENVYEELMAAQIQ